MRAKCRYLLKQYDKALSDLDYVVKQNKADGSLYNLRGICHHLAGNDEDACRDFEAAMKMGDPDGEANFRKFCGSKAK